MAFRGFVYRVTAEETCLIPVGDLHAAPMSSPFTSGFFPGETAIKAYWGITVKGPPNCSSHCHLPFWGVIGLFFPCCGAVKGSLTPCCSSERCVMMSCRGGRWGWDVEQQSSPRSWGQEKQEGSRGGHQGFLPAPVTISTLKLGWAACGKPQPYAPRPRLPEDLRRSQRMSLGGLRSGCLRTKHGTSLSHAFLRTPICSILAKSLSPMDSDEPQAGRRSRSRDRSWRRWVINTKQELTSRQGQD